MSDTTPDTDHAAAIKDQARKLAEGNIWAVDSYIAEIERHVDALAEAEARAALQLDRAERLAQTILGLCEGDANDLEFELDLYPLDLYDQTGGEFVVPTKAAIHQHAGELQDSYKSVYHIIRLAQAMQAHAEALSAQLAEAETYPDAGAWQQMVQENDDLRAQLAEAEARAERALSALEREVNRTRRLMTRIPFTRSQIVEYCRLQDGDFARVRNTSETFDAAPGDTAGER